MNETEWLACEKPVLMLDSLGSTASVRKLRLCACACCRLIWPLLEDERSRTAVEVAERFADDIAVEQRELLNAYLAAVQVGDEIASHRGSQRVLAIAQAATGTAAAVRTLDFNMAFYAVGDVVAELPDNNHPVAIVRDIYGNPFRPVNFSADWRTDTALSLAKQMYESRDFSAMPILADALQDAGCENDDILSHCRGDGPHVRGCWVVDLVLGKE